MTHDLAEAAVLADRLALLMDGRVVATGTVAEVLATPPKAAAALLLGWHNVLPVTSCERVGQRMRTTLQGGQRLTMPLHAAHTARATMVALRADRLEVRRDDGMLTGTLQHVVEIGAYCRLTIRLGGADEGTPALVLTCSPREWGALGCNVDDQVWVRDPDGAARLVEEGGGKVSNGELSCSSDHTGAQRKRHPAVKALLD